MAVDIQVIAQKLCERKQDVVFLGDGVPVFRERLEGGLLEELTSAGKKFSFAPAPCEQTACRSSWSSGTYVSLGR